MTTDICIYCREDIFGDNFIDNTGYCNCKVKYHKDCLSVLQNNNFKCVICRTSTNLSREQIINYIDNVIDHHMKVDINNYIKKIIIALIIIIFINVVIINGQLLSHILYLNLNILLRIFNFFDNQKFSKVMNSIFV